MPDDDIRDEFLSEEDLDLRNLSPEELEAYWMEWFRQAQATNDQDKDIYSHGVLAGAELLEAPWNEIVRSDGIS